LTTTINGRREEDEERSDKELSRTMTRQRDSQKRRKDGWDC
jgi:hypothetical protein